MKNKIYSADMVTKVLNVLRGAYYKLFRSGRIDKDRYIALMDALNDVESKL